MATDARTADDVRRRLHQIRGGPEEQIGNRVVAEGLRQLNLPGQYTRGLLAGRPGEKATSEEMLGRPLGPVGRLAWDVATDPLTYAGPGLVKGAGKAADLLRLGGRELGSGASANPLMNALERFGREESGAVKLPEFFHGSSTPGITRATLDPLRSSPRSDYGRGIYLTSSPEEAVRYATAGRGVGRTPTVYKAGVNPAETLNLMSRSPQRFNDLVAPTMAGQPQALNELDRLAGGDALDVLKATQRQLLGRLGDEAGSQELIRLLRGGGYDALLAQEGAAAVPNRTMVVLDPRDAISQVGRPGGITSWRSAPQVLKRYGGPGPGPPSSDPLAGLE